MDAQETQERLHDSVSPEQKDASVVSDSAGAVPADPLVDEIALAEAVAVIDVPVAGAPERSAALSFAARGAARLLAAAEEQ
jgi:hypothetical protein